MRKAMQLQMKNIITNFLLTAFSVLTLTSCKKLDVPKDTPTCVKREITKIQSDKVRNPPASDW
ncbi:MAG: hypothetical protein N2171_07195 [Clostridia bacterium]|nr:hypothetical protein [Clostridia bacterium]